MKEFEIPLHIKQRISPNQAFHYRIVPLSVDEETVLLKTDQKDIDSLSSELSILLDFPLLLEKESSANIESYLSYNYRKVTSHASDLSKTNFLEQLLQTAKDFGSSDIHIEPYEKTSRVRFRLDGKLKTQYNIAPTEYPQLINQIKNQAGLDIAQKRLSQDGRITVNGSMEDFDIRVSTMPTLYGEKVVLRILKRDAEGVELSVLGLNEEQLKVYLKEIRKPNGLVLISGPTGSGKTTTLYGTLKLLNKEESNVLTIEDPIEYKLDGVNQVQLKEDIGLDFPTALRTFLRQDPDIIMVGEIRDEKTANMAIKAALTGHLVLSTIHTNSAWATISRLMDMGIPSFLVANTLNMSIAQRLIRKLCENCKRKDVSTKNLFPDGFEDFTHVQEHFVPVGCNSCHFTGYLGRQAIYEIIPITDELKESISKKKLQIDDYIANRNIDTLKSNALQLIKSGVTSIDEVYSLLAN